MQVSRVDYDGGQAVHRMDRLKTPAKLLATWEWLGLLFLLAAAMFLAPDSLLPLLVIPPLLIGRKLGTGRFFPATPFDLALAAFGLTVALATFMTFDPGTSWPKLVSLALSMCLFHAAVNFCLLRPGGLWVLLATTLAIGVGMALVGLFGGEWGGPFEVLNQLGGLLPASLQSVPGTTGGLVSANELAGALAWTAPLMIACLVGLWRPLDRRPGIRVLLAAAAILTSLVLLATMSRGGIVAFVAGLGFVVAFFVEARWRFVVAVSLFVGALVMFFTYRNPQVGTDILGDALGLAGRIEIWQRGLQAVSDFPLTGSGINSFREVVGVVYPLYLTSPDVDLAHAHNHLLQAALDLGIPGLVAYLALWLVSFSLLWRSIHRLRQGHQTGHPLYALTVGLAGSLLAGWIFGLADAIALGARPAFVWWLLLALTAAVHYQVRFEVRLRTRVPYPKDAAERLSPPDSQPATPRGVAVPETRPAPRPSSQGTRRRTLPPRRPASFKLAGNEDVGIISDECGIGEVVSQQLPKLLSRVRIPYAAPSSTLDWRRRPVRASVRPLRSSRRLRLTQS